MILKKDIEFIELIRDRLSEIMMNIETKVSVVLQSMHVLGNLRAALHVVLTYEEIEAWLVIVITEKETLVRVKSLLKPVLLKPVNDEQGILNGISLVQYLNEVPDRIYDLLDKLKHHEENCEESLRPKFCSPLKSSRYITPQVEKQQEPNELDFHNTNPPVYYGGL